MKILKGLFQAASWQRILLIGLFLVVSVGVLDYLTGYRLGFSLFYILPIYFVTWFGGLVAGFIMVLAATISWFIADYFSRQIYISIFIPVWNIFVRLGVFSIISLLAWLVRFNQERQKAFTHYIIHDLRNPLNNINLALGLLSGGTLGKKDQDLVKTAQIASRRLNTLITSILDLERLKKRKMPISKRALILRDLIATALEQVSVWAENNSVRLESKVDVAIAVVTDQELLLRVLVNLLNNAIKVSPEGSIVKVIVAPAKEKKVVFQVVDQGRGIPKSLQKNLFNKFIQAQNNKVAGIVGSGLGLAFCRQAIEALGGKIWVESEEGKGSTFAFTLPVR